MSFFSPGGREPPDRSTQICAEALKGQKTSVGGMGCLREFLVLDAGIGLMGRSGPQPKNSKFRIVHDGSPSTLEFSCLCLLAFMDWIAKSPSVQRFNEPGKL
jgi:hypothetical protein